MNIKKLSLLLPTMNRSDFLIRLLNYYRSVGFQGYLCIGDSSNAEHLLAAKKAIETLQGKLNIYYREYPDTNNARCLQQLNELAPTDYCALIADDDYLVPDALEKCISFLDNHPDYSAAHGQGIAVRLQPSGVHGQVASIVRYQQTVSEGETASRRIIDLLGDYQVALFSVHRTGTWRKMYQDITSLTDIRFTELLPGCLSVVYGKVKELDCFYLVRQSHDRRYMLPGKTEWMARPDYLSSYQVFFDCITRELARQDGISIDKAKALIEQAFLLYLASLVEPWQDRLGIPRLMKAATVIPGARQVWRASQRVLRAFRLAGRDEISLKTLLDASSPDYADFAPIYRSMTGMPAELPEEKR